MAAQSMLALEFQDAGPAYVASGLGFVALFALPLWLMRSVCASQICAGQVRGIAG